MDLATISTLASVCIYGALSCYIARMFAKRTLEQEAKIKELERTLKDLKKEHNKK